MKLAHRFAVLATVFAAGAAIAVSVSSIRIADRELLKEASEQVRLSSRFGIQQFNLWVDANGRLISVRSRRPLLRKLAEEHGRKGLSPAALRDLTEEHLSLGLSLADGLRSLWLLDPAIGEIYASTDPLRIGLLDLVPQRSQPTASGEWTTQMVFSPLRGVVELRLYAPVFGKSGDIVAYLAGEMDWEAARNILQVVSEAGMAGMRATLLHRSGEVLLIGAEGEADPEVSAARSGLYCAGASQSGDQHVTEQRVAVIVAHARLPLCLVVAVPGESIFAPARELRERIVKVMVLVSLLAALAGFLLTALMLRPLRQLVAVTEAFGRRDFTQRAPARAGDEIGELGRTMNAMADSLAANTVSIDRLTAEVDERVRAESEARVALQQLKDAQQQMIQMEKLSALGTLVGGVAHEINNPLMGLSGYVDYARGHVDQPRAGEMLDRAKEQIERIARLVRSMLVFARIKPQQTSERCHVAPALARTLELMRADLDHREIVVTHAVADDIEVRCSADVLQQVLLNLLNNARDALGAVMAPRRIDIDCMLVGADTIALTVADNGPGIGPEAAGRIFNPFFTTKPPGKGTGLGLAVSRQLLQAAGGSLDFDRGAVHGARFTITLQRAGSEQLETAHSDH